MRDEWAQLPIQKLSINEQTGDRYGEKIMMHRIGAVFYVMWGILHLNAANMLYQLSATLDPGVLEARVVQAAWHLAFFGVVAIAVGMRWNWRTSALGYWINIVTLTVVDLGFIVIVFIPYLPFWPAVLGPLFWVLAVIFSTTGYVKEPRTA